MNPKQATTIAILMAVVLLLSACSGQLATLAPTAAPVQPTVAQATKPTATMAAPSQPAATQSAQPTPTQPRPAIPPGDLTRTNEGGSVTFAIKPINLGSGASTLDFDVSMNTHSVELNFDLKQLAVLKTDTGAEVKPSAYQVGSGHHVESKLSFPSDKIAGAKTLTLILKNVAGVAERTFIWNLQ
jgi:hypothetical protein